MALSFFIACSLTIFHLFFIHIPRGHLMLFVPCYYCIWSLMLIFLLAINSMTYLYVCDTSPHTIVIKTFPLLVVFLQGEQLLVTTYNFHLFFFVFIVLLMSSF